MVDGDLGGQRTAGEEGFVLFQEAVEVRRGSARTPEDGKVFLAARNANWAKFGPSDEP